jgi:hypothetical protein
MADSNQRRKRYIRWGLQNFKRPIRRLVKWAKVRDRIKRFSSLQQVARQKQEAARTRAGRLKWKALRYRFKAKVEYLETHKDPGPVPNLVSMDGRQVPGWIAEILQQARSSGAWGGYVVSGYRSPSYSISLCYAMCGRPSCSGMCAGAASNHAAPPSGTGQPYEGAVDVTDPYNLRRYVESRGLPLVGGGAKLSRDHVHFSRTGY